MGSEFTIQVQGDRELLRVVADLRGRLTNLAPAWQRVGDRLVLSAKQRFWLKVDPAGQPWKDWSPSYSRWRRRKTGAVGRENLLTLTGHMRDSINASADDSGVIFGVGRSYAPFHELGTRKMPRRAMFLARVWPTSEGYSGELGNADRRMVLETLMEFLHG